jgi:hypothetical protein
MRDIGKLFGKKHTSVNKILRTEGGIRPYFRIRKACSLSLADRATMSIGSINIQFSLFHQVKNEIRDAIQLRNLTDLRREVHITPSRRSIQPKFSHQACRPPAAIFARSNLLSWLSYVDLIGYPNKPVWDYEYTYWRYQSASQLGTLETLTLDQPVSASR